MKPVIAAAALLASCATLLQAAYTPPNLDPAAAPAGLYAIEPGHSQLGFTVWHLGLTRYTGVFPAISGTLRWDPRHAEAMEVDISVATAAVQTTSAALDAKLRGADWLDVARYPAMQFRSRKIIAQGPHDAAIAGDLTLHGQTHPLTLTAQYNGSAIDPFGGRRALGFTLSGALRRSDWGVASGIPFVSDAVTLSIAAAFERR